MNCRSVWWWLGAPSRLPTPFWRFSFEAGRAAAPSVQDMKRLAPLLVGIWLVPAVALAQYFESIPSSRRTWDDFHCGFKTDRDNVVRKNRGFACSVSFSDDHILLTDDHPVIDE